MAAWGVALITLIQVIETLIYTLHGYDQIPVFLMYVLSALYLLVGLVRMTIPLFLARFIHQLCGKEWKKSYSVLHNLSLFILSGLFVLTLTSPLLEKELWRFILSAPRFAYSLLILSLMAALWRWRRQIPDEAVQKALQTLSIFWGIYATLLLFLRLLHPIFRFFTISGSILRILVALVFYLFHLLFARCIASKIFPGAGLDPAEKYSLSLREREIVSRIVRGKTNKEIADDLFLSIYTVRDHCSSIMRKCGVRNRTQLAARFQDIPKKP